MMLTNGQFTKKSIVRDAVVPRALRSPEKRERRGGGGECSMKRLGGQTPISKEKKYASRKKSRRQRKSTLSKRVEEYRRKRRNSGYETCRVRRGDGLLCESSRDDKILQHVPGCLRGGGGEVKAKASKTKALRKRGGVGGESLIRGKKGEQDGLGEKQLRRT